MRTIMMIAGLLLLACCVARADTENLQEFLRNAETAAQVTTPLRGDGQFEVTSGNAMRRDDVALIVRPPTDMYVELHREGIRALLLNEKGQDSRVETSGSKPVEFPLDATFADSDFTREDLMPFRVASYKQPRITDETGRDVTITLFPTTPQYSLIVMTFDREKKVPLKTLYYRDTLNNLVKMRRDDGYILVGRKWMATVVSMETFKLRTHTSFNVRWSQDPQFPPELFDPVFLARPSGILWPIAPTPPSAP